MTVQALAGRTGVASERSGVADDSELTAGRRGHTLCISDSCAFGDESAAALQRLSPDLSCLNRRYRRAVESRGLRQLPDIAIWQGRLARVFLRHDAVFVFAIACGNEFGMTNSVELRDVRFEVCPEGRQQTLDHRGPLSNRTAVHAYLTGIIADMSNEPAGIEQPGLRHSGDAREMTEWRPVIYRPAEHTTFVDATDREPVHCSPRVLLTPGTVKVWRLADIVSAPSPGVRLSCGATR